MKLLLHACCGPCSIEPVRLLLEAGHNITLHFANSNIHPREEYERRLQTLRSWTSLPVVEGSYDPEAWHLRAGVAQVAGAPRAERCRRCYHLRLEEAAAYAQAHGFEGLSTTLAVSPYQCFEECREELEWACDQHGLRCVWQDFRPFYPEATRKSRELGMYRQNYCGCVYSQAEAAAEREQRRAAKAAAAAEREQAAEIERRKRAAVQAIHERKQAAKREARLAAREAAAREARDAETTDYESADARAAAAVAAARRAAAQAAARAAGGGTKDPS